MARGKSKRWTALPEKATTNKPMKMPIPYEAEMQRTIIEWTENAPYKGRKVFNYTHHTPNGGFRSKSEAARFKAMGVKSGYPDLSIDIVTEKYAGLRIELKRGNQGKLSEEQIDLLAMLNEEGYYAVECNSIDGAIQTIQDYIKGLL